MRAVLLLEGGGSLGAFAAGAWKALSPLLRRQHVPLHAVAGSSIGAVNAAVIARHHAGPDGGAVALERFWRERVATPSFPFTGSAPWSTLPLAACRYLRSFDGLLTGLLIGNRALHVSQPANWTPIAALFRSELPLLDRTLMRKTLMETVGNYETRGDSAAKAPLLAVAAVDMQEGKLHLFHSDDEPITPNHLMASSAIPLLYAPVELGGRMYWDGDMTRDSLLPLLLRRLREPGRIREGPLLIITVTQRPRLPAVVPTSEPQLTFHLLNLLLQGKFDIKEHLASNGDMLEPSRTPFGGVLAISRDAQPHDAISREFDYSHERIDELITQGEQQAAQAWNAWLEAKGSQSSQHQRHDEG